jgi:hypothetical protein
MAVEINVKIKNSSKSITKKKMVYKTIEADFTDSTIDAFVAEVKKEFGENVATKLTVNLKLIED